MAPCGTTPRCGIVKTVSASSSALLVQFFDAERCVAEDVWIPVASIRSAPPAIARVIAGMHSSADRSPIDWLRAQIMSASAARAAQLFAAIASKTFTDENLQIPPSLLASAIELRSTSPFIESYLSNDWISCRLLASWELSSSALSAAFAPILSSCAAAIRRADRTHAIIDLSGETAAGSVTIDSDEVDLLFSVHSELPAPHQLYFGVDSSMTAPLKVVKGGLSTSFAQSRLHSGTFTYVVVPPPPAGFSLRFAVTATAFAPLSMARITAECFAAAGTPSLLNDIVGAVGDFITSLKISCPLRAEAMLVLCELSKGLRNGCSAAIVDEANRLVGRTTDSAVAPRYLQKLMDAASCYADGPKSERRAEKKEVSPLLPADVESICVSGLFRLL